jgi:hypothetical protein
LIITDYIRVTHPAGGGELSNEPYTLALPVPVTEHPHRDRVAEQAVIREAITAWLSGGGTVQVPAPIRSRFAIALFPLAWDAPGLDRWQTPEALRLLAGEHDPHEDCGAEFPRCRTFAWLCQTWARLESAGDVDMHGGSEWRHAVAHLAWTVIQAEPAADQHQAGLTYRQVVELESGQRPELARRIETHLIDVYGFEGLADVAEPVDMAVNVAAVVFDAPLSERAPEVGELLKQIRGECEEAGTGRWFAGDTTAILRAWFIKHGYETDGPNPGKADDHG